MNGIWLEAAADAAARAVTEDRRSLIAPSYGMSTGTVTKAGGATVDVLFGANRQPLQGVPFTSIQPIVDQRVLIEFHDGAPVVTGVFAGASVLIKAGPVTDADFPAPPPDFTEAIDTTNLRRYIKVAGTWRYSTLT